ncbi:transcription initiation protein [Mycobacterium sp. PS03-16]|uniref:YciI family protein n=1 Tax=Mycobacterium sp. PS03-16 TaxID=2559611 RepID=UPI001074203F|nr:YciI family protein [Mycobacterium sp. PS03-16]TFV58195.1 transcription initiation protein [Mycobacterium sp. PS03-16]
MHYFALLLVPDTDDATPQEQAASMTAYENFHARAGSALLAGDALLSRSEGARTTGGPDRPVVTDGPFAESAEVAGGYYVLEADNLDEALELARDIPAAHNGAVEVWPMVHWEAPTVPMGSDWFALLLEPPGQVCAPDTDEWESGICQHEEFGKAAGDHILGGAPLQPPSTATTVRVRDGQMLLTDGPFAEGAEVANGFYLLRAADRDEAVKIASMIPASTVEVFRLAGIAGL